MAEKVVVAVDGGPASDAAVRWVAARAHTRSLEVDVTTVIDGEYDDPAVRARQYERLHAARTTLGEIEGLKRVTERTRLGRAVDELVKASKDVDLLVVGTNGTSGLASLLHKTLPLSLAGRAHCPLVVVPASWVQRPGPVVVGWEDDGSADEAVDGAAAEAADTRRDLHILHSWTMPPANALDPSGSADLYQVVHDTQRDLLDREVRRIRQEYPRLTVRSSLTLDPADVALGQIGEHASLLVIGSHGRGAIADLLMGSVGDDLIRKMVCPVMIIRRASVEPIKIYPELVDEEL